MRFLALIDMLTILLSHEQEIKVSLFVFKSFLDFFYFFSFFLFYFVLRQYW